MNIIEVTQGSKEWKEVRARHFTASEAPAMMGESKYTSRSELLRQKSTGIERDIDEATQYRFNQGHDAEALARPHAEALIGQDLYPVTCTAEIDGLPLLASLDGLTMDESTIWEHKLLNAALADTSAELDPNYYWQLEHQLLVTGAKRVLFMASDGSNEHSAHRWYESVPERRAKLIAGWKQFAEDLGNYRHVEVIPAAVAAPIEGFGALVLNVEGRVLACNLDAFNVGARSFIERLPKANELTTDQHFANAEAATKACADAESRIRAAKDAAMAQAADIDTVFRAVDLISEEIRQARLSLEKAVKARKESIRVEIMQDAQAKLAEHVKNLNERIGGKYMPAIYENFAGAVKNKRTVASLHDAVDTELARCKIEASAIADCIHANLAYLHDAENETALAVSLLPDLTAVVSKPTEDFIALVKSRIADYKTAEIKRIEKERELMRIEEERKANAAAREAAMPKVIESIDHGNGIKTIVIANTPPEGPEAVEPKDGTRETPALGQRETLSEDEEQAIWRNAKQSVVVLLDGLTISELQEVASYINRKAWRKAA